MKPKRKLYKKKNIGNYPYINVIFSTTLALFIIGLFLVFAIHIRKLTNELTNHIKINIFLEPHILKEQKQFIKEEITKKPYVFLNNNKTNITFISKEAAAEKLIRETGEDFLEFLEENPLYDAFVIEIKRAYYTEKKTTQIKSEIESIAGIYEVAIPKNLIEDINQNLKKVSLIIALLIMILLITIVVLINSTIKLAFFSQRFLIRSMQLVGATPFFIKKPFLLKASWQGGVSGIIASVLLLFSLSAFVNQLPELSEIQDIELIGLTCLFIIILGIGIGFFSSLLAVNKYIKMKLDELY